MLNGHHPFSIVNKNIVKVLLIIITNINLIVNYSSITSKLAIDIIFYYEQKDQTEGCQK
jgi:hypothetical protein